MQNLSKNTKIELYKKHQYMTQVPEVTTAQWGIDSWLNHIDANGIWITDLVADLLESNKYNIPLKECQFYGFLKDNYTGNYIEDLKAYLESKGFKKGLDIAPDALVRCFRYQHEYYFTWEVLPTLEKEEA